MAETRLEQPPRRALAEVDWVLIAVVAALVLLAYFTLMNHVYLYPFNNLAAAGPLLASSLVAWFQFIIFVGLLLTRRGWSVFVALVIAGVWLAMQIQQWYLPYVFGSGPTHWFFERGYHATLKVLPPLAASPVTPDLQHNILQLLSFVVLVTAVFAFAEVTQGVKRKT
jgi:hypothetical protein